MLLLLLLVFHTLSRSMVVLLPLLSSPTTSTFTFSHGRQCACVRACTHS